MSTTTSTYALIKHARGDTPWDVEVNANYDSLDTEIGKPRYPFTNPTVGATTTLDLATARSFVFTVSQATTIAFTNVPSASFYVPVELIVTNGAAFAVTWPASVSWLGGIKPTFKAAGVDLVDLVTKDGGTTWYASLRNLRPGVIFQDFSKTTTSGVDVSLDTYVLPAGTLAVNGQALRVTVALLGPAGGGNFNFKFGGSASGTALGANQSGVVVAYVVRLTATTQIMYFAPVGAPVLLSSRSGANETLANAITIDFRGNVTTGGQTLTYDLLQVELLAVA